MTKKKEKKDSADKPLMDRQLKTLEYIALFTAKWNLPPNYNEIRNAVGYSSKSTVSWAVKELERQGLLRIGKIPTRREYSFQVTRFGLRRISAAKLAGKDVAEYTEGLTLEGILEKWGPDLLSVTFPSFFPVYRIIDAYMKHEAEPEWAYGVSQELLGLGIGEIQDAVRYYVREPDTVDSDRMRMQSVRKY